VFAFDLAHVRRRNRFPLTPPVAHAKAAYQVRASITEAQTGTDGELQGAQ
jgi:hypothetical protein